MFVAETIFRWSLIQIVICRRLLVVFVPDKYCICPHTYHTSYAHTNKHIHIKLRCSDSTTCTPSNGHNMLHFAFFRRRSHINKNHPRRNKILFMTQRRLSIYKKFIIVFYSVRCFIMPIHKLHTRTQHLLSMSSPEECMTFTLLFVADIPLPSQAPDERRISEMCHRS